MSARIQSHRFLTKLLTGGVIGSAVAILFAATPVHAQELPPNVVERQQCGNVIVDSKGYGAGMMMQYNAPEIQNVTVTDLRAQEGCAVLTWGTNIPASVQVVYTESSNEPVSIDLSADNFGYPYATPQNNSGEAAHTAILDDLEPGVSYSYRVVTRAHPTAQPRISDPRTFVLTGASTVLEEDAPDTQVFVTPSVPYTPPQRTTTAQEPASTPEEVVSATEATTTQEAAASTTTGMIPSALNAARSGLGAALPEREAFAGILSGFHSFFRNPTKLAHFTPLGFFERDEVIAPVLLFIILLLLIQHTIQPLIGVTIANKALYWLIGSGIFVILAAASGYYYLTFAAIALFLAFLAWYLIQGVPEVAVTQRIPFIENTGTTKETSKTEKKSSAKSAAAK